MNKNMEKIRYNLAVKKGITPRRIIWLLDSKRYTTTKSSDTLPIKVYRHNSLIRRTLGRVDGSLQENKAINLHLAAPLINGVLIKPGETFSFWQLVGKCSESKGYKEGLVIKGGQVSKGIGGGMCQFSNLIHWMVLHSPLTIIEHHHHNQLDMFPDFGRSIPFGTGTSIMYNYLDYQFTNTTNKTFQLLVSVETEYLCGELRCSDTLETAFHIIEEDAYFVRKKEGIYRHNKIYRHKIDKLTGDILEKELILENFSKVMYDEEFIDKDSIRSDY